MYYGKVLIMFFCWQLLSVELLANDHSSETNEVTANAADEKSSMKIPVLISEDGEIVCSVTTETEAPTPKDSKKNKRMKMIETVLRQVLSDESENTAVRDALQFLILNMKLSKKSKKIIEATKDALVKNFSKAEIRQLIE